MTPDDFVADEPLDPALKAAAQGYHEPPRVVPREAMWSAIEKRRRADGAGRSAQPRVWRPRSRLAWQLAAAIVVLATAAALGWGIHAAFEGRGTESVASADHPASVTPSPPRDVPYRIAVTRELTQAEALLAAFRASADPGVAGEDPQLAAWARDLLVNTHLLLDSPAAADPERRRLLEDLELVLVQMVELGPDHTSTDRRMIDQTLDRHHVLPRLRAAVPAGGTGI